MEYAGNKVYNNGTLSMILTEEGYATLSGTTPTYHYYLKDHQGNNRVVINQGGTVQQVNHYYPFGGLFGEGIQISNQPYKYSGKELDRQFGLDISDHGARHYDAALGRWFTVDPLTEKYYSISSYAYVANNPIMFVDPDGRENIPALNWARKNMSNKGIPFGVWFGGAGGWTYKKGTVPSQAVCYESCFMAYMNSTDKVVSHLKETGFATKSGGFLGRSRETAGINWFKNGNRTDRSFVTDIGKGELGDIVFMGEVGDMQGHAVLLNGLPVSGSYTDAKGKTIETMTLNTLSTASDSDPGNFGERTFTFEKQKDGSWKQQGGAGYTFRGYGQMNSEFSKQSKTQDIEWTLNSIKLYMF